MLETSPSCLGCDAMGYLSSVSLTRPSTQVLAMALRPIEIRQGPAQGVIQNQINGGH